MEVVEVLLQVVVELLLAGGSKTLGKMLANAYVRSVLGVAAGLGLGAVWGLHLNNLRRSGPALSVWVSAGIAVASISVAISKLVRVRMRRARVNPIPASVVAPVLAVAGTEVAVSGATFGVRGRPIRTPPTPRKQMGKQVTLEEVVLPWRWPAGRLTAFALANIAGAIGVFLTYTPV